MRQASKDTLTPGVYISFPHYFSTHPSSQSTAAKVCIPLLIPSLCSDLAAELFHLRALRYCFDLGNESQVEGKSSPNVYPPASRLPLLFGFNSLKTQSFPVNLCGSCFRESFMFRISNSLIAPCVLFFVISWKMSMSLTLKNDRHYFMSSPVPL